MEYSILKNSEKITEVLKEGIIGKSVTRFTKGRVKHVTVDGKELVLQFVERNTKEWRSEKEFHFYFSPSVTLKENTPYVITDVETSVEYIKKNYFGERELFFNISLLHDKLVLCNISFGQCTDEPETPKTEVCGIIGDICITFIGEDTLDVTILK